jgi:hypothetical protein
MRCLSISPMLQQNAYHLYMALADSRVKRCKKTLPTQRTYHGIKHGMGGYGQPWWLGKVNDRCRVNTVPCILPQYLLHVSAEHVPLLCDPCRQHNEALCMLLCIYRMAVDALRQ